MDNLNNVQEKSIETGRYNVFFIIAGWLFAILSLLIYPFIFGVLGVIMGILATKNKSRAGLPVIVASIVFMGIGLIFSPVLLNYVRHFLNI